jgi:hypothetical protein
MLKFLFEYPITSIGMAIGSLISVGSMANNSLKLVDAGLPSGVWQAAGAAIFFLSVIILLARWHNQKLGAVEAIPGISGVGPHVSPLAELGKTVPNAHLRLLMRPQQEPEELTNENIYRWFSFRSIAQDPKTHDVKHLGSYVFLVFRTPVMPNYRRAFSPTHPNLRLDVIDVTSRSMVVIIDEDPTGATLDIQLSQKPI